MELARQDPTSAECCGLHGIKRALLQAVHIPVERPQPFLSRFMVGAPWVLAFQKSDAA